MNWGTRLFAAIYGRGWRGCWKAWLYQTYLSGWRGVLKESPRGEKTYLSG